MMLSISQLAFGASRIAYALAHAKVTSPSPRAAGSSNLAACGAAVQKVLKSDEYGPIENAVAKKDSSTTSACDLYTCRGYKYQDNTNKTRLYTVGQTVNISVEIVAHHTGYANVSVIDLKSNSPLARLYSWDVYANETLGPSQWPKNESEFSVTIPDLDSQCETAGACAIQWYWYAYSNDQTYESCIDFTVA